MLCLPVVGCFECFRFPVICAEASWPLDFYFYGFSTYSCHLGHEFCYFKCPEPIIWQAWCLHLSSWGPFCQLRDALAHHGSNRKDTWGPRTRFVVIFDDFGTPFREPFSVQMIEFCVCFLELVSRSLFASIFVRNY